MNFKIPRVLDLQMCHSCKTCKFHSGGGKLSGWCDKHSCVVMDESVCTDGYQEAEDVRRFKSGRTVVNKQNIEKIVEETCAKEKVVVKLNKEDLIKYCKRYITYYRKELQEYPDELYLTIYERGPRYHSGMLLDRPFDYNSVPLIPEKDNILYSKWSLIDACYQYLYDTYQ